MPTNPIKEIERLFDETLPYLVDSWGKLKPDSVSKIKSFIRIQLISVLKSLSEEIERSKTPCLGDPEMMLGIEDNVKNRTLVSCQSIISKYVDSK